MPECLFFVRRSLFRSEYRDAMAGFAFVITVAAISAVF
jgi:hypothetical protein